jgi:hypothetical protein
MAARNRHSDRINISVGRTSSTRDGIAGLQTLLTELAGVLLPRGMTPKWFNELARAAFVQAAANISRPRNGRPNHSRIAVQTGLTRADVKRLLKQNAFESTKRSHTAVERVIEAWRTDPEFIRRPGQPKRLSVSGGRGSFARLVKKYAGDVTPRAVLDELRHIGAVQDCDDAIKLRRPLHLRQRGNFAFLLPVLPVLIDRLRLASKR